jgi:hypothetical protein
MTERRIPMFRTFVKRPVVIQAIRWDGNNVRELSEFMGEKFPNGTLKRKFDIYGDTSNPDLVIFTLEGDRHAAVGDWIIRGTQGEFYPCKPDIFEQIYEEIIE